MTQNLARPITLEASNTPFWNYIELTKPRLTLMVVATTFLGFILGSAGPVSWTLCLHALFGTLMVGCGANTLNQVLEKDVDLLMKRTQQRPLPAGRLSETRALLFGGVLSVTGILHLFIFVNSLTSLLGMVAILNYALIYTPLKRRTPLNTLVGAVSGALPILMGWTASSGQITPNGWVLFFILMLWQLPHFTAIAWVYRDDYIRGGFKMMTTYDEKGTATAWQIVLYTALLVASSILPYTFGMTNTLYLVGTLFIGAVFMAFSLLLVINKLTQARPFAIFSLIYLSIWIFFMFVGRVS